MWDNASLDRLKNAVTTYDKANVGRLCDELVDTVAGSDGVFPNADAKQVLNLLRRKRFFAEMRKVAEALIESGQASGNVRRQYAQALIECEEFTAAIGVLKLLIEECANDPAEVAEARGLIGRALKQQYVNNPKKTAARRKILNEALAGYYQVYQSSPALYLWHGINAVALAKRAARDGVTIDTAIDVDKVAAAILDTISKTPPDKLYAWDMASAAEACVALGRNQDALEWLRQYVAADNTDAFEVASSLRQLREVWSLGDGGAGSELVSVLDAALLQREGGAVSLSARNVQANVEPSPTSKQAFEKVFAEDGPVRYQWYVEGMAQARAVGRVEDPLNGGIGTGFLVRAADFFSWAKDGEILFVTNAHVMGRTESGALAPESAEVRFEAFDPKRTFKVKGLIWESPVNELDATFVRLENLPAELIPMSLGAPEEPEFVEGGDRRFFIIGYPKGGSLALSLNDNMQVRWRKPKLHYRTPTLPGSSGSPVLDQSWKLVALHHAGSKQMQRLDGHAGLYEANEGIWIHEIIGRTREAPAPKDQAADPSLAKIPTGIPAGAQPAPRQGVFISYSHKDKKYLGELETYLRPYIRSGEMEKWDDMDLKPGADWLKEIRKAVATCRVALLLVSQDYLASDFISAEEFPKIINEAEAGGVTVFWIALAPSTFLKTKLASLQAANDPAKSLSTLTKPARLKEWVEIVKKLETALSSPT